MRPRPRSTSSSSASMAPTSTSKIHAEFLRGAIGAIGAMSLDSRYGALLDAVSGATLSIVNPVSLFELHRRWRGALIGHPAMLEMCSVRP